MLYDFSYSSVCLSKIEHTQQPPENPLKKFHPSLAEVT